ncbi:copper-(or silver)-translocating P-type ATPase [Treponema bryantii]|uniref:P-type Zn(2+) transporter n=1 Tax=Treponema bryantii TaxID=163 RepID=A0A1H9D6J3_9SPIR|nr:cation-translocating P-type ATPase [Treponema bryantii]SEQ09075.1 copper-(or silver)-translocating P-type ATPase [Treponema bryantii]
MSNILEWYEKQSDSLRLIFVIISGVALATSLTFSWTGNVDKIAGFDPAWIAIVLCGVPIVLGAIVGVVKDHDITADVLVALALIGSLILKEFFAAGEVAFIMQIGSILEDFTSDRAKKGISKLIKLSPKKANLFVDGQIKIIEADQVKLGDILQVRAGESIPVDGKIIEGSTSIDQSAMTGESIPVEKNPGDLVMSGTINQNGSILIEAVKTAGDSSLQRMIKLAEAADVQKAKIVRKANVWAAWLVVVSLTTAIIAGTIIGNTYNDFWLGFTRAVTVLVVFCPCAFVLATPTAISAGIGNASKHGLLIQSGEALERIASSNIAVFDKTGTLTKGKPAVVKVQTLSDISEDELIKIAASGEALSNHPLAKAIMDYNKSGLYEIKNHKTLAGSGIEFEIDGKKYMVGKVQRDFKDAGKTSDAPSTNDASFSNISPDLEASSLVGLYCESKLLGIIFIQDALKENARKMVAQLKALNIRTVMLTGDNENSARYVAAQIGLDDFKASCSPEDKMNYIKNQEARGHKVAMFGDGVNDSLALRSAFAGIAMGGIGSDVAIESADAVIVHDNLDAVPYLFKISRKTQGRITFNLCLSMVINFAAVALAISGILNAVWGALFHNCGSVLVVFSAFLLLFYKDRD